MRFVFFWEKYISDDPNDPGGLTVWGISYRSHPEHVEVMRQMDEEASKAYAKELYRKLYWQPAGCDQIIAPLDIVIFDCAVNQGLRIAKEIARQTENWQDAILLRIDYYDDAKKANLYLKGWSKRVISLSDYINLALKLFIGTEGICFSANIRNRTFTGG
jgi:hypothetical protein